MAGAVMFFWGRMLFKSFDHKNNGVQPMPTMDMSFRALTPTATPWTVLNPLNEPTSVLNTPTQEIYPTQTPFVVTATPTTTPEIIPTQWFDDMFIPWEPGIANKPDRTADIETMAKLSYYYPPYAYLDPAYEINCDKVNGVLECEHMANGQEVKYFIGEALACPPEFPFGTVFKVMGGFYTCRDRGGAIQRVNDNLIWLDLLYPYMPGEVDWGYETEVKIWLP